MTFQKTSNCLNCSFFRVLLVLLAPLVLLVSVVQLYVTDIHQSHLEM